MNIMLIDSSAKRPVQNDNANLNTSNQPAVNSSSSQVETKVGNPTVKAANSSSTSPTPTPPKNTGPTQKSQIYTISQNFKSVTFKATYDEPNLLVDFVVTDPKGKTYTIGDEKKYEGKLVTEWKSNSRLIRITDTQIDKGMWTITLDASKNVPINITLEGSPK